MEAVCDSLQLYLIAADQSSEHGQATNVAPVVFNAEDHPDVVVPSLNDGGAIRGGGDGVLITCEQVLDVCWQVLCHWAYSVTRRAAGLWPAVKAAVLAEQARGTRLSVS